MGPDPARSRSRRWDGRAPAPQANVNRVTNPSSASRRLMAGRCPEGATDDGRIGSVPAVWRRSPPGGPGASPPELQAVLPGRRAVVVLCVTTIVFSGVALRQA